MPNVDFSLLEKKIKIKFKDSELIQHAFVHRSYLNENRAYDKGSNERLEFLGDAILEFIVSEYLYKTFPEKEEGDLTAFRSALVCSKTLSKVAEDLGFGEYLYLSKGEEQSGGRQRPYILGNTFEAVLGAIYLDQGLKVAHKFVYQFLLPELEEIIANQEYKDSKSELQELTQEKVSITPHYDVLNEKGPDHNKWFQIGVFLEKKRIGVGEGKSKQIAEQNAAKEALKTWPGSLT